MTSYIGKDKNYLIKDLGLPTKKVNEAGNLIWLYEHYSTRVSDEKIEIKIKKYNESKLPEEKQIRVTPAKSTKTLYYDGYIFDESGHIIDTFYGNKEVEVKILETSNHKHDFKKCNRP